MSPAAPSSTAPLDIRPPAATSPEALVAALLSEASYVGKSKAFGWEGIPNSRALWPQESEAAREALSKGEPLSPPQLERLREAFWRDDLIALTLDEIKAGADLPEQREQLARRLWVALFARPFGELGTTRSERAAAWLNPASENIATRTTNSSALAEDCGFSRQGVFRSSDAHCVIYAKVWTPEEGLGSRNRSIWVAARGTENNARALQNPLRTFLSDYALKAYRNFAKAYKARYKDSMDATLGFNDSLPESQRFNRVVFCGHSLGGSEAIEAVIQGKEDFQKRAISTAGYTFGSPGSGKMGALSAALAVPVVAMLGLAHAGSALLERFPGLDGASQARPGLAGPMSQFSRMARVSACKTLARASWLPGLELINRASVILFNAVDAFSRWTPSSPLKSLNAPMLSAGWVGFRSPGAERWAEQEGGMTHYAHKRDFIRLAGESAGLELPGKTALLETHLPVGGLIKEHSASLYISSLESQLKSEGQNDNPWMRSLEGCRVAMGHMLDQTAILHRAAVEQGRESSFIQSELATLRVFDQNEAPAWLRQTMATEKVNTSQALSSIQSERERQGEAFIKARNEAWLATVENHERKNSLSPERSAPAASAPVPSAPRSRKAPMSLAQYAKQKEREIKRAQRAIALSVIDSASASAAELLCAGRFKAIEPPASSFELQGPLMGRALSQAQAQYAMQINDHTAQPTLTPGGIADRLFKARALKSSASAASNNARLCASL